MFFLKLSCHFTGIKASGLPLVREEEIPLLVFSGVSALAFIADRTGFWLKEQKEFNPWIFAFLSIVSLAIGLLTVKQADKDLGFLNREQTDEWKGWMQSKTNRRVFLRHQTELASSFFRSCYLDIPLHGSF